MLGKFAIGWLPVIIFGVPWLSTMPGVADWLREAGWTRQIELFGAVFLLFTLHHLLMVYRPILRMERVTHQVLDSYAATVRDIYSKAHSVDLRINVMEAKWTLLTRSEPKAMAGDSVAKMRDNAPFIGRSLTLGKRGTRVTMATYRLKTFWLRKDTPIYGDEHLELTVNQGACGLAFRRSKPVVADLTIDEPEIYNLTSSQISSTRDLKFVVSCPIFKLDRNSRPTKRVIGVVNLDCRDSNAEHLVQREDTRDDLVERATAFSRLCSCLL
ncbi:MAG: hypothetical protein WAW06_01115 [bacterium]